MRTTIAAVSLGAVAVVCSLAVPLPAQIRFRTDASELVVLPVTVADRHGHFVADLPADRFAVYDNNRRQQVALFSNQDTPVTIGVVLDNSGSMRAKQAEVIAATMAFARASNPADELFTVVFDDRVRSLLDEEMVPAGDAARLETALFALRPDGRTSLYDGLAAGLDRLRHATRPRKVLVLVSDGGDNASDGTLDDVLKRARLSDVTIYAIGVFDRDDPDANPRVLQTLARTTGGSWPRARASPARSGAATPSASCRPIATARFIACGSRRRVPTATL